MPGDEAAQPPLLRRAILSLIAILLLVGAGFLGFRKLAAMKAKPEQKETVARPIAVRVLPLSRTDFRETLSGYGRARALRATAVSAEVAGIVERLGEQLEPGAEVAAGEPLVWIDDRDLKQALASAEARLARNAAEEVRLRSDLETAASRLKVAESELAASKRELERIVSLKGQKVATDSELDRQSIQTALREAAVLELRGRLPSLRAQLDRNAAERRELSAARTRAELDLARAIVRAPYAGRIEERHVQEKERVAVGATLFRIVDLSRIEIPIALPAARYGEVQPGAAATVRLPRDGGATWDGTIERLSPTVRVEDRTFYAYVVIENGDGAHLPPGAFTQAEIAGRTFSGVFVLPRTAFVGDRVFVEREGVARARSPELVAELPHVLLASGGVADGDHLIVTNLEEVADGTKVRAEGAAGR
jgi:membrane fusion protein (multidrug efflux system)